MKKSLFLYCAVAVFAGVFGALRLNDYVTHRGDLLPPPSARGAILPAEFDGPLTSPADFRVAAKKVIPSVVSVDQYQRMQTIFGEDAGMQETGTGSGVIIAGDGTIVTNNHVVAGADRVRVRLSDGRSEDAQVLGTDPRTDLAVIRIKASGLSPVELGDSSKLEVGQWVVAVGNPLGFNNTVSVGVVSSLNRSVPLPGSILLNGIQTDAAINPGNSGGALTNAMGQLVGINSAIASNTQGNVGIGFAIPVNRVRRVVNDIVKYGQVRDGVLGIVSDPRLDNFLESADGRSQMAEVTGSSGVPSYGVIVKDSQSPASVAGIGQYSVILEIDGKKVVDSVTLNQALIDKTPGDKVSVKFWTKGSTKTATITLSARSTKL